MAAKIIITKFYPNNENLAYKFLKEVTGLSNLKIMDALGRLPWTILENIDDSSKLSSLESRMKELDIDYKVEGQISGSSSSDAPKSTNNPTHGNGGCKIFLTKFKGNDEFAAYKAIKKIKNCSMTEAMQLVTNYPSLLCENVNEPELTSIKSQLEQVGLEYKIEGVPSGTSHSEAPKTTSNPSSNKGVYKIYLTKFKGNDEFAVYKAIKKIKKCSMTEAMQLVTNYPSLLCDNVSEPELTSIKSQLEQVGLVYKIEEVSSSSSSSTAAPKDTSTSSDTSETTESASTDNGEDGTPEEPEISSAEATLAKMIGLTNVKREVEKIKAYIYKNEGEKINCHMFFLGNPGTGKTVVARLMGEILYSAHALPTKKFIECSAKDLIAEYIGQTAVKTAKKIEEAMGGILYIDEAYSLNPKESSFGKECVDCLIKAMEDKRGEFCCIFAGYPEDMDVLIDSNPGFDSRVKFKIMFDDYSKDELRKITSDFLTSKKYLITDDAMDALSQIIDMSRFSKNFGNARTARTISESLMMIQAVRTKKDRSDKTITMEDIDIYCKDNNVKLLTSSNAGESDARAQLDKLIGLSSVKETIDDLISFFVMNKDKKTDFHMAFMGNPGTGKTVVARIIGELLHQEGLLPSSKFIECTSTDLIAEYIGQTAPKTKAMIQKAMGGVLFIDEAYTLAGAKGSSNSFGPEAVAELLKAMEDKRGEFAVILAGYTKEMHDLFDVNPGLQSRVKFELDFPNYTVDELIKIGEMNLKKDNYTMDEDTLRLLVNIVYSGCRDKNYANARSLREAISKVQIKQAGRIRKEGSSSRTLEEVDIRKVYGDELVDNIKKYLSGEVPSSSSALIPMVNLEELRKAYADFPDRFFNDEVREDITEAIVSLSTEHEGGGSGESSGFIFSEDGYVATCAHCVRGATKIDVRTRIFHRGKNFDNHYVGHVVVIDNPNDVAIVKIESDRKFVYVPLAPEDVQDKKPLSKVYLLGYPFGHSRFDQMSVNEGKIASYQRGRDHGQPDQINLDISAKSGNSGSAVIDEETGKVIGILCGSSTNVSGQLVEEINYCRPISYIWDHIKEKQ